MEPFMELSGSERALEASEMDKIPRAFWAGTSAHGTSPTLRSETGDRFIGVP
jgi:hypothetical protein